MTDFGQLIVENWDVIKANWKLFVLFGLSYLICCAGLLKLIYDNILYKDLPERRELQAENEKLQAKIQELTEHNRTLLEENRLIRGNDQFLKGVPISGQMPDMGRKIADALPK